MQTGLFNLFFTRIADKFAETKHNSGLTAFYAVYAGKHNKDCGETYRQLKILDNVFHYLSKNNKNLVFHPPPP
jgi:hypothetical protein